MGRIVSVDFDGVLHSYPTGWRGADVIDGGPVEGAIEWLRRMVADGRFDVQIFSSRSADPRGVEAMRSWLWQHGLDDATLSRIGFPTHKPPAFVAFDDRAVRFDGRFWDPDQVAAFQTWQQEAKSISPKGLG